MNDSGNVKYVIKKKIGRWLEPIGLAFLLVSFGWQCLEERTNQMENEGYLFEMNEKLISIWDGIYDDAVHSDRYNGKTMVFVDYDSLNASIRDWSQMKKELSTIDRQANQFFWIRAVLYCIGSICIILSKWASNNFL